MPRYLIQFESRALPGQDEVFIRWYDHVHMPDVLAQPGFLSCHRFRVVSATDASPRYVAMYEVQTENPQAALRELYDAAKSMTISTAHDTGHVAITILEPRAKPGASQRGIRAGNPTPPGPQ
jgi:hypothetical protein